MRKNIFIVLAFSFMLAVFPSSVSASDVYLNRNSTWGGNLADVYYGSLALGDIDNDGRAEVIDSSGTIHKWIAGRLHAQMSLGETIGEDLHYGLESIYVGDIFGDGHNRVIFTGRCSSPGETRCYYPRMYVVSAGDL